MNESQSILTSALTQMVEKIDQVIRSFGYQGEPVKMILAGGMAVNYYCGSRYTGDVDATFSKKILLPYEELIVFYQKEDGTQANIYFDTNYSPTLALMHEDYETDIVDYQSINNQNRTIELFLLSPIDLAISKIARFSDQDVADILTLADHSFFTVDELRNRAEEALSYYIGNVNGVKNSIDLICQKIEMQVGLSINIGNS